MKSKYEKILNTEENIYWHSIPIKYDNYPQEKTDKYYGDIFGKLNMFESPHYLFRRFHKNFCKAIALTKLKVYKLIKDENDLFLPDINELFGVNFTLEILMIHNATVLLVTSLETYLKDNFIFIARHNFHDKLKGKQPEQLARKFNFQNIDSIKNAFNWLLGNFDDTTIYSIANPKTFNPFL